MAASRSPDDVKREIAGEREHLGDAIKTLRSQVAAARRRLPVVALGAAGAGLAARTVARRFSRRTPAVDERPRFSFRRPRR